jgi:hypothetical protein
MYRRNEGEMKNTLHSIRGWAASIMPEPIESKAEIT